MNTGRFGCFDDAGSLSYVKGLSNRSLEELLPFSQLKRDDTDQSLMYPFLMFIGSRVFEKTNGT